MKKLYLIAFVSVLSPAFLFPKPSSKKLGLSLKARGATKYDSPLITALRDGRDDLAIELMDNGARVPRFAPKFFPLENRMVSSFLVDYRLHKAEQMLQKFAPLGLGFE